jgi:hypothetical protein
MKRRGIGYRTILDFIYPVGVESDIILDLNNSRKRLLVSPCSVVRSFSAKGNAVISAVSFVRAVCGMTCPLQERHVDVPAWNVLHGRVRPLAQSKRVSRVCDDATSDVDDDVRAIRLDCDRVIGPGKLLCLGRH